MSPATVVQVSLWNSPYLGNFMSSQLALARIVQERLGLATHHVLANGAQDQAWLADLDAQGVSWSVLSPQRAGWRRQIEATAREREAAVIHTHFTAADLVAASVAHAAHVPCVWHIHTGFNGYPVRQRVKDLVKMRLVARRRVARIVTVSPWLGEFVRRRGAPAERIAVLPNPIVVERFAALPERAAARERLGLRPDATVVLALGWWPEVKGVDVLIEAMSSVAKRHPSCQVLLVGEERMRTFLSDLLPELPGWLRLSGFISDVAWLFAAADIFVSASRHEGQPSAIGEALACGLPVVMSDIAGVARWAGAPRVSLFPSEDVGALARQLDHALSASPQDRVVAGTENRRWIERHAGLTTWCDEICAIYEELLGDSGSGSAGEHPPGDADVLGGQLAQHE